MYKQINFNRGKHNINIYNIIHTVELRIQLTDT